MENDAQSRPKFLDEFCANDSDLRSEVESMLESHEDVEDFIEMPVFQAGEIFSNDLNFSQRFFGNYKIINEIGAGGMSAVFSPNVTTANFLNRSLLK